jgi:DNA-binding transcriptional LysR family regulator
MNVTFKQLEVFRTVVLAGNITNARRPLGLAQPTISQQLAKLEEELGVQLFKRSRGQSLELTPAGEFWFRTAEDVIGQLDSALMRHKTHYSKNLLDLRFGTTPSLRGRFLEEAASFSLRIPDFSRFEFVWGLNSDEVVEMIIGHRVNCGVVSAASVDKFRTSLSILPLFRDEIVWIVPASIPDEVIASHLETKSQAIPPYEALNRYVDVGPRVPWKNRSENWFRAELPYATPHFICMTHQAAVDLVAGGMATCHCPKSLLPNLPEQTRCRIKFFGLKDLAREAVFAMPKHLLSLRPFADFRRMLADYTKEAYPPTPNSNEIPELPRLRNLAV